MRTKQIQLTTIQQVFRIAQRFLAGNGNLLNIKSTERMFFSYKKPSRLQVDFCRAHSSLCAITVYLSKP